MMDVEVRVARRASVYAPDLYVCIDASTSWGRVKEKVLLSKPEDIGALVERVVSRCAHSHPEPGKLFSYRLRVSDSEWSMESRAYVSKLSEELKRLNF